MPKLSLHLKSVLAIFLALMLFACEGNYREIQQLSTSDFAPVAEAKDVNLKYTDSGRLVTNLISPKLLDFSNFNFGYTEFPDGLELFFWNEEDEMSTVISDYGISYDQTNVVDLRGNVMIITSDSLVLSANQLYWDQDNKWLFTDQPYRIRFKDGSHNDGEGFDSSEDFNTFLSRKNTGVQFVDNTPENDE